ncbi:MAG: PEP-CTERM sorting domain-containing protein [Kastovskya adunca ATA6-11-RM4]|nr:PEP-CTERM sorting domain-containing protein [Kastovskya adunca ATA6-11-RM4]
MGDTILGEFSPGTSVDFVSLFGEGVPSFKIGSINSLFPLEGPTAFPIRLGFNNEVASFKMRPFSESESPEPESVPEPSSIFGLFALGFWGVRSLLKGKSGSSQ